MSNLIDDLNKIVTVDESVRKANINDMLYYLGDNVRIRLNKNNLYAFITDMLSLQYSNIRGLLRVSHDEPLVRNILFKKSVHEINQFKESVFKTLSDEKQSLIMSIMKSYIIISLRRSYNNRKPHAEMYHIFSILIVFPELIKPKSLIEDWFSGVMSNKKMIPITDVRDHKPLPLVMDLIEEVEEDNICDVNPIRDAIIRIISTVMNENLNIPEYLLDIEVETVIISNPQLFSLIKDSKLRIKYMESELNIQTEN